MNSGEKKYIGAFNMGLAILLGLFASGCEQYQFDVDYADEVTVNAFLSSQEKFWVNLSFTENPYELEEDSFIRNASVYLELPDKTVKEAFRDSSYDDYKWSADRYYELAEKITFVPGDYRLIIEVPGYETITASDYMPNPVAIEDCSFYPDTVAANSYFLMSFADPVDEENYYAVTIDEHRYETHWLIDSLGNGDSVLVDIPNYTTKINSTNFFVDAVVFSQIIFSDQKLSNSSSKTQLRIEYAGSFDLENLMHNNTDYLAFDVQLHAISKAYYKYAIDYYGQNVGEKAFYEDPISVFSNVVGGYGIFAAYSTSSVNIVYQIKK